MTESKEAVEDTCKLACLEKDDVNQLLTSVLIRPQSSYPYTECRRNLGTEDACRYRLRSIIRHMYELLFHWLISSVNKIMSAGGIHSEKLGISESSFNVPQNSEAISRHLSRRHIGHLRIRVLQYERYRAAVRQLREREIATVLCKKLSGILSRRFGKRGSYRLSRRYRIAGYTEIVRRSFERDREAFVRSFERRNVSLF